MQASAAAAAGPFPGGPEAEIFLEGFLSGIANRRGPPPTPAEAAAAVRRGQDENDARLREAGVDPEVVRAAVSPHAARLADALRGSESAAAGVAAFEVSFAAALRDVYRDMGGPKQIAAGVAILVGVQVVLALVFFVTVPLMGGPAGVVFNAVVAAPLAEELGRWMATRGGLGGSYTAAINVWEFVTQVPLLAAQRGVAGAVLVRTVAMAVHTFMAALQRWGHGRDVARGAGDPGRASFFAAVLLHGAWNAAAILSTAGGRAVVRAAAGGLAETAP